MSVCTGALLLAKAGLLDGLRATTHHEAFEELAALAPRTEIMREARFVDNGQILTSAGADRVLVGLFDVAHLAKSCQSYELANRSYLARDLGAGSGIGICRELRLAGASWPSSSGARLDRLRPHHRRRRLVREVRDEGDGRDRAGRRELGGRVERERVRLDDPERLSPELVGQARREPGVHLDREDLHAAREERPARSSIATEKRSRRFRGWRGPTAGSSWYRWLYRASG